MTVRRAPSQFVPADRAGSAVTPTCGGCCCCCCCAGSLIGLSVAVPLAVSNVTKPASRFPGGHSEPSAEPQGERPAIGLWLALGALAPVLSVGLAWAVLVWTNNLIVGLIVLAVALLGLTALAVGGPRRQWGRGQAVGLVCSILGMGIASLETMAWWSNGFDHGWWVTILVAVAAGLAVVGLTWQVTRPRARR